MQQLGLSYDIWDMATETNAINAQTLAPYRVVIWRVAEFITVPVTPGEQTAISNYLSGGGSLFIASMELPSRIRDAGYPGFVSDVLRISQLGEDAGVTDAVGVPEDPIGADLDLALDHSFYWDQLFGNLSDTVVPTAGAVGFLKKSGTSAYVGLRYPRPGVPSAGRMVYLSFPFDTVTVAQDRTVLLRRILTFLAPGLNGEGNLALDRSAYTIPSQLTVEIGDSDLEQATEAQVTFFSLAQPSGLPVTLQRSTRPGLFSGKVALASTNTGSSLPELLVSPGETIRAQYFDASLNVAVVAQALVETNKPVITNLFAEPGYVDAIVGWDTSELTDATVQFGESPLLGRTAAADELETYHEVGLTQLLPDKTYYYRVISRDRAGNVSVDDNAGRLYTFSTLKPLDPPWSDDMEHGDQGWSVYTPAESELGWTLGAPSLLLGPANSPMNCWGINLDMGGFSQAESYLLSPAIFLTGGNRATLRFAQSYDFTEYPENDIFISGEVLLIPNDALSSVTLATYSGDATDWHDVELDLTPYVGKVVYLAFHYFMFSMDYLPRQGWLIDDVSVTMSDMTPGTLVITNSLRQAAFSVAGPISTNGSGALRILTNAPPGSYTVVYAPVPNYQTPQNQVVTLNPGGSATVHGVYQFPDVNANGIPDTWELKFFGNASTYRTAATDTDGDGMTDYDEFIAGTDPNNPPRPFKLLAYATDGGLKLEWASVPGQMYQIHGSLDAVTWTPVGTWLEASSNLMQVDLPLTNPAMPTLFRVQAGTNGVSAGLPANLRVTANRLANGALNLVWPTLAGRSYRVMSSTNQTVWTMAIDWFQASGTSVTKTVPGSSPVPTFYRVQVEP